MKIAMLTHTFLPNFVGGRETYVLGLSKALINTGHKVTVFTGEHIRWPEMGEYSGIPVRRFPMYTLKIPSHKEEIPYRIVSPTLLSSLRSYNPDVVHAHDYRHFTSDISALYCFLYNKPFILTVHGFFYKLTFITRTAIEFYDATFGRFSLKIADRIICVSAQLVKPPLSSVKNKIITMANAISVKEVTSVEYTDLREFRKRFKLDLGKVILGVGRLTIQKGFQYLIEAYKRITESIPNTRLVIVGPKSTYSKELELLAKGTDTIFTGSLSPRLVKAAYSQADLFVMPSLDEGSPLVLLEAMAFGKPIVASPVGMIPNIIEDNVSGILVEPKVGLLANVIVEILNNDGLASKLSQNARRRVMRYDWENSVSDIVKNYYLARAR